MACEDLWGRRRRYDKRVSLGSMSAKKQDLTFQKGKFKQIILHGPSRSLHSLLKAVDHRTVLL